MTRQISVEPLLTTPIVLITSRNSPHKTAKTLAELSNAHWIMIGAPLGPGDIFRKPFIDRGLTPPKATTTSESYFGAMSLVQEMGAVCAFPLRLLEDVRQGWDIEQIHINDAIDPREISLMSRASHPLTPMAEELAKAVRRRVAVLKHEYNQ